MPRHRDYLNELQIVDHPSGLTPVEVSFCINYVAGMKPTTAYKMACPPIECPSNKLAAVYAGKVLRRDNARRFISELMDKLIEFGVASAGEVQMYLTDIIRTPISEIDDDSPLCQKKTITVREAKDGSATTTTRLEMVDKLAAVKALNKMRGYDAPKQVDIAVSGGVMHVPLASTLGEWEGAAEASQAALMADAIDI